MSVFRGSITEYPGVIVDHFIPFNCERGRAFFLSHCHKDHMTGLGSPALLSALQRRNAKLYCSEVTRLLLLSDPEFTKLATFLESLPMEEPISMTLEAYTDCQVLTFTVTLLPAGHCPGSAMFFFQGTNGNVLYTGDFRLTLEETRHLHHLYCGGRVLDITTLYLDTTFCTPVATEIPSREVSRDHILTLIERWLSQSPKNVVHLQCGMFGYEHILMGVAKKFNTKIHIAVWKLNAYKGIPAVAECLTTDGNSTRVHACNFRKGAKRHPGLPCGSHLHGSQALSVLRIKPSTLWFLFAGKTITEPYVFIPAHNKYRVIHSMHASYNEICSFVSYLKPKRVVPCVIPLGDSSFKEVHSRLKDLLPQSGTDVREACSEIVSTERKDQPPLRPLQSCSTGKLRKRGRDRISTNSSESDSDWSSGESNTDTIDEFPSSEEQTQQRTVKNFSNVRHPLPSRLGLPSMLTPTHRALSPSSPPSSVEASDGTATLGSLQQTPLDLSFGSSASETQPTPSTDLLAKKTAPSTDLLAKKTVPSTDLLAKKTAPSTDLLAKKTAPSTDLLAKKTAPSTDLLAMKTAPSTDLLAMDTAPSTDLLAMKTAPSTDLLAMKTAPSTDLLAMKTAPSTDLLAMNTAPSTDLLAMHTNDDVKEPCPKQPIEGGSREDQHSPNAPEPEIGIVPEKNSTIEVSPNGEWHLSLDESPEAKNIEICSTPHSKRYKLEDPSGDCDDVAENEKTARKLFHKHSPAASEDHLGAGQPKEGTQFLQVGRPPEQGQSVECIDLTQDSDEEYTLQRNPPTTENQDHQILQEDHPLSRPNTCRSLVYNTEKSPNSADHQKSTHQEVCSSKTAPGLVAAMPVSLGTEPEIITLSDSQTSTSTISPLSQQSVGTSSCDHGLAVDPDTSASCGAAPLGPASPLYLPPTPGREGVESILKRRSIAFT